MKIITIKHKKPSDRIVITIPVEVLCRAAEENPDGAIRVIDKNRFAEMVTAEIENYSTVDEADSGLTHFMKFLDDVIMQVAESGDDCVVDNNEG